ncbi:MAG TPA: hypothetical protein VFN57_12320 [Thermomicrobiaceae bacterium]|nr:hypothetical protein [Thermomicrobiaceae bacterium]
MNDDDRDPGGDDPGMHPWFGPGRFGGMHPQTWQGVAITLLVVVLVAVLKSGLSHQTLMALLPALPLVILAVYWAMTRR